MSSRTVIVVVFSSRTVVIVVVLLVVFVVGARRSLKRKVVIVVMVDVVVAISEVSGLCNRVSCPLANSQCDDLSALKRTWHAHDIHVTGT